MAGVMIERELTSFPVPTGVFVKMGTGRRQDGFKPQPEILLKDLSEETLEALCKEFRRNVFTAAGYTLHPLPVCSPI